jgi:hypothetical protein
MNNPGKYPTVGGTPKLNVGEVGDCSVGLTSFSILLKAELSDGVIIWGRKGMWVFV